MIKLNTLEIEIINLGIKNGGIFNEFDLQNPQISKYSIGKILDTLGDLRERNLIELSKEGGFTITELGSSTIWNKKLDLRYRILKILQAKGITESDILRFLDDKENEIAIVLDNLRKENLVLMSPTWRDSELVKSYEILDDGIRLIEEFEEKGDVNSQKEVMLLISEVISEINKSQISSDAKEKLRRKMESLRQNIHDLF